MKLRLCLTAAAGVAVLWIVVLVAMHLLHARQPTALSVTSWIQRQEWSELGSADRARRLDEAADQLNHISLAERQKLSETRALEPLMRQMTEGERLAFLDKTLPKGFAQWMDSINRMTPEARRRMVSQALEAMKKRNPDQERPPGWDDATVQKVAQKGFDSYLENASTESKMDLAPLIQQMQVNMQGLDR